MKREVGYRYQEGYLPSPRHRKLRYRENEDKVQIEIPEVTENEAPIAFIVKNVFGPTPIRFWGGRLWTAIKPYEWTCSRTETVTPDDVFKRLAWSFGEWAFRQSKEEVETELKKRVGTFLFIDGTVYHQDHEPCYEVCTFGFSGNDGGTSLMTNAAYDPNENRPNRFNSLQFQAALEEAEKVAVERGDTESVKRFREGDYGVIQVLIPEAVKYKGKIALEG